MRTPLCICTPPTYAGAPRVASATTCAPATLDTWSCRWWCTTPWCSGGGVANGSTLECFSQQGRSLGAAVSAVWTGQHAPACTCHLAMLYSSRPSVVRFLHLTPALPPSSPLLRPLSPSMCECSMLYRLMKNTCLNCHQFKMGRQEVGGVVLGLFRGDCSTVVPGWHGRQHACFSFVCAASPLSSTPCHLRTSPPPPPHLV